MKYDDPKKNIIDILGEHPEGLTIKEISKLSMMSRSTVNKYLRELIGKNKIYQRIIGAAKLCYLNRKIC